MTVKDLKKLLNEVPEGITLEEFDNMEIMVYEDGTFTPANPETSGIIEVELEPIFEGFESQKNDPVHLSFFCLTNQEPYTEEDTSEED